MAQTKIEQGLLKFTEATDYLKIPTGTTAQRPSSPNAGYIRFNTTISAVETYDGTKWIEIGLSPPTFSSVDYPGSATALDPAGGESLVINGDTFNVGITITIGGTTPSSITRNSATQLTVTTPAKTAGTYDIVFTNTDGGTATATNAVSYNGVPAFTNAAGSLGSVGENEAISFSVAATEPDGGAITYAVTSGALPSGASLNASTGAITGTAPSVSADTIYNFTITATDNENQTASRAYSITVTNLTIESFFKPILYTGDGTSNRTITTGFPTDLVWIKATSHANSWAAQDSTRGVNSIMSLNTTGGELDATWRSNYGQITSFTSTGFVVNPGSTGTGNFNSTNYTYIAYCFRANGGTTSSNTDGAITSTVQVNNTLGMSIVKWTGTGSASTVGHGLSAAPKLIIQKSIGSSDWPVYHGSISSPNSNFPTFNNGGGLNSISNYWGSGGVTSSVFGVIGSPYSINASGVDQIAYCFTEIAGFSKFDSYTGSGTSTGPIVNTGFKPALLIIKKESADNWFVYDNKRDTSNPNDTIVAANLSDAQYSNYAEKVNFYDNGFQPVTATGGINGSGAKYLYIAFAAAPDTTTPTLADSFNAITYSGNGSTQSISGFGFQPNFIWIKNRTNAYSHQLYDSVRGAGSDKNIQSDNTSAEGADANLYGFISSFDSDGYTVQSGTSAGFTNIWTNQSGQNYVAWAWKADDALPTINTDGDINSIVSANSNAGFSIVKYIGDGSTSLRGIGHGLSAAPELIIQKSITNPSTYGTSNWRVGGTVLGGAGKYMYLNLTNAVATNSNEWGNTQPDATKFYVSGTAERSANESGIDYINYCFHSVSGYSKIGSYTGTGTTNSITGLGFQPDWLMIKRVTGGSSNGWVICDSARGVGVNLRADTAGAEVDESAYTTSFDSDGFTLAQAGGNTNVSGSTYIYAAFKIN